MLKTYRLTADEVKLAIAKWISDEHHEFIRPEDYNLVITDDGFQLEEKP